MSRTVRLIPLAVVLAITSYPTSLLAAKTSEVEVVNPVLPVEVRNADPILVTVVNDSKKVTYSQTTEANCPFLNQCLSQFSPVPAGKQLHITFISSVFTGTNVAGLMALSVDSPTSPLLMFPVSPYPAAYYLTGVSLSEKVDVIFEAGQTPVLQFGVPAGSSGISNGYRKFTITGYLLDVVP